MNDVAVEPRAGLAPFSLRDAPAFIERQFPVGRLSAETHKERMAVSGQTLAALGSYWKGRKPLILVRAVVLGCLIPASDDLAADLDIFLKLMAMSDDCFGRRFAGSAAEFARLFPSHAELVTEAAGRRVRWRDDLTSNQRNAGVAEAFATLPYAERLRLVRRPEECDEATLLAPVWPAVNQYLGTAAASLPQLVEQLGIARFGKRPRVADTFCGGGSIPFEAARIGCDVYASDLNPVASMLTWGAFNIIGAATEKRAEVEAAQQRVAAEVDASFARLGIENDAGGNRAKAYLYCLETECPRTGWIVPMAPSWVISRSRNVVAILKPNHALRRYHVEVQSGVSAAAMTEAEQGTVRDGRLVHPMNSDRTGVDIRVIRGDYRDAQGVSRNRLRFWELSDFKPRSEDIFQERLYCIQWTSSSSSMGDRQETFFAAVTHDDIDRENRLETIVRDNLKNWQDNGLVPEMPIQPGGETTRLHRERGWTYWHHLFCPRELYILSIVNRFRDPAICLYLAAQLNYMSRLVKWNTVGGGRTGGPVETPKDVFYNQTFNTMYSFSNRSASRFAERSYFEKFRHVQLFGSSRIAVASATDPMAASDLCITDPPYADAVNYHEITEFFIAWLRKNPPPPFDQWTWDSRRDLAIKGRDEQFRRDMVAAYANMTRHMPDHGQQVVMFTHQDAGVWADLGAILWAAGLRVTAAWNIVTETESALKAGNYVQGTVCLVLRKRLTQANARRMEIEAEIEAAVAEQLARLNALDDAWHARAGAETLYTDGDLTLAAYAAALQVVTAYSTIDRQPLDRDLYRRLGKREQTMLRELIDYAASVANTLLVPDGFPRPLWRDLAAPERFYVRMLDMEAQGSAKVADFQAFARSFAFVGYTELMASTAANAAALAGAADLKGRLLDGEGFAASVLRQVLFAVWKTMESGTPEPRRGLLTLKTEYTADYWQRRQTLIALADYVALKTARTRATESQAAQELAEALRNDRV